MPQASIAPLVRARGGGLEQIFPRVPIVGARQGVNGAAVVAALLGPGQPVEGGPALLEDAVEHFAVLVQLDFAACELDVASPNARVAADLVALQDGEQVVLLALLAVDLGDEAQVVRVDDAAGRVLRGLNFRNEDAEAT